MKVLVAAKRVIDAAVKVSVNASGIGVDSAGARMSMNPFDEIALEAALQLREAGIASEVIVASIGPAKAEDVLRTGLAMGADRALLVETAINPEPLAVAKLLRALAEREEVGLTLLGKQAIDDDAGQVGQMLAALLARPQAVCASRIEIAGGYAVVECEVDDGLETVRLALPAVITVDLRLNQPRYVTLPNIMKAKKKPLDRLTPDALGVDMAPQFDVLGMAAPARRKAAVILGSPAELVEKLRNQALIGESAA